jgi:pyruvate/2-oxoglutarate dehydrogenase complex dihydrolipoamide acyltransferase (E2) component
MLPFSRQRELVIDVVKLGRQKHHIPILFDADITDARIKLKNKYNATSIYLTGWIIKCITEAVVRYKQMHALRNNKRSIIIFDDIDILLTVEKTIDGEKIPLPFIIRKTNTKTLSEITNNINLVKQEQANSRTMVLGNSNLNSNLYLGLPNTIRTIIGKMIIKNPFILKKNTGTIGISSIGMMGNFNGWAIPVGPLPLQFYIGSIIKKPRVINNEIKSREIINICYVFDHDMVDGALAATFTAELVKLLESSYGLEEMANKTNA